MNIKQIRAAALKFYKVAAEKIRSTFSPLRITKKCNATWGGGERSLRLGADCDCRIPAADIAVAVIGFSAMAFFLGKWMAYRMAVLKKKKG